IDAYDEAIRRGLAAHRGRLDLLGTVPGIDEASACAILIELGPDIAVFPNARHCAAWAGLCPGNNESAGKRRPGRARKGNTVLRAVPVECAQGAARTKHCQFNGYHRTLTRRRGYKRATVATAHKLLRTVYRMLRNGEVYRDPETDYEKLMVQRNAPRWIKMPIKHGIDPADWAKAKRAAA
ncbi:MAG: transposase, partial [Gammaproteobacteria bacterium]|nr:transposase [Gammaproteobacteria bacterium]